MGNASGAVRFKSLPTKTKFMGLQLRWESVCFAIKMSWVQIPLAPLGCSSVGQNIRLICEKSVVQIHSSESCLFRLAVMLPPCHGGEPGSSPGKGVMDRWCNGSTEVSKTSNVGSTPARSALYMPVWRNQVTQLPCNQKIVGSIPITGLWGCSSIGRTSVLHAESRGFDPHQFHSWVAQLVEQPAVNRSVAGSSPVQRVYIFTGYSLIGKAPDLGSGDCWFKSSYSDLRGNETEYHTRFMLWLQQVRLLYPLFF